MQPGRRRGGSRSEWRLAESQARRAGQWVICGGTALESASDAKPDSLAHLWFRLARQLRDEAPGRAISLDTAVARIQEAGWSLSWEDLHEVARRVSGGQEVARPPHVLTLFVELAAALKIRSAVDPCVDSPAVIGSLAREASGRRLLGITGSTEAERVARRINGEGVEWLLGDPSRLAAELTEQFDWVVSSPPIGLRLAGPLGELPEGLTESSVRDEGGLLAVANAIRPETRGVAVLVTEGLLWRERSRAWRDFFASKGLQLSAAISVAEALAPVARVPMVLCTFTRESHDDLFVARVTPTTDVKAVAQGLATRTAAKVPELGALVAPGDFQGWDSFSAGLELKRYQRRSRVPFVPLGDLALEQRGGRALPDVEPDAASNALYLTLGPVVTVTTVAPRPKSGARNPTPYVVIELDPERANADFLARWLNSPDGRIALESVVGATVTRRIPARDVDRIPVPLPVLDDQSRAVKLGTRLSGLRHEAENLESRLWAGPWLASDVDDELRHLTEGDPLEAWINRLPFPLAATAHRYRADADKEQKVKRLLYFFETCAEFCVIALLSALKRDPDAWEAEKDVLREPGPSGRHPLSEGQFGGWIHLGRHLAKAFRGRLNGAADGDRRTVFGVSAREFVDPLIGKDLWATLDEARNIRNERGHGGEWSPAKMRQRLEALERILGELRDISNRMFTQVVLVQPGPSELRHGTRRYGRARHLAGPVNIFLEREIVTHARVDLLAEGLCLVDRTEVVEDALALFPLVRMMPSPGTEENAAYFFNKIEGENLKFVSYHFPGEEVEAPLNDPSLAAIVGDILGLGDAAG